MSVRRLFVEKKQGYDIFAQGLFHDLRDNLGLNKLKSVRIINRYDIEGISDLEYNNARQVVFAEPPVDILYDEILPMGGDEIGFAVEYLPGQYDQRADSASQCIQLLTHGNRPDVATAQVILLRGLKSPDELEKIKKYYINPVDSREAAMEKPPTLIIDSPQPPDVAIIDNFIKMNNEELEELRKSFGLAMRFEDVGFCQNYFRTIENRDPSITEIRMLDTYWSDHCRHTTFLTYVTGVEIEKGFFSTPIERVFAEYKKVRSAILKSSDTLCLMEIATMGMKQLKAQGLLDDLDTSEEINACSIVVPAVIDGQIEEWLVMFKNETHNHPTEIEPFGGAATCLGGAIRDPLSGRSYVYQAMRVTGSGDPGKPLLSTLPGKLPQRKITTQAAHGYSSYGNQIGIATGIVAEIYDEGYIAKRMEIGAVVGAAPKANVIRATPQPGDLVLLIGGRTGRDGCGGATGSSKEHTEESIHTCSAEVQKGNPPVERKLQRLFRNSNVTSMIKRCNDFGAGGVSVAIGELASGLQIDLDSVPRKYEGLDGTELAISESQERMAVVIAPDNYNKFVNYCADENLETALVARVTDDRRLVMKWRGKPVVDISRDFIDTNGVQQKISVLIVTPDPERNFFKTTIASESHAENLFNAWQKTITDLNVCSQRGLVERFDSTIGAGSVLLPFGGRYQMTPSECMVARLPVLKGETTTGTAMSYGYNPSLSRWSPFHGAVFAVLESVARLVAAGADYQKIRLTLQEYFEKPGNNSNRWGKPFAALLGAWWAQSQLGIAAIGGKDSMSGTFKDLDVPPTLVSFALAPVNTSVVITPEFKDSGRKVAVVRIRRTDEELPVFSDVKMMYKSIHNAIINGKVTSAYTVKSGGIAEAITKMCLGNRIGFKFTKTHDPVWYFTADYGSIIIELASGETLDKAFAESHENVEMIGITTDNQVIEANGEIFSLEELQKNWENPLSQVFPPVAEVNETATKVPSYLSRNTVKPSTKIVKPRILITVFPGTNCEYDTARAFENAGGVANTFIMKNCQPDDIVKSIEYFTSCISQTQIIMIPGGFSAGDEPDGSGKFISAFFRNPHIRDAVHELLFKRDGLMLGICNGFQSLIKLGLVPWGEIRDMNESSPTLTFNTIGRHISRVSYTRVCSVKSPWLAGVNIDDIHAIPISHGEGRFTAPANILEQLIVNGQVATQYVNQNGVLDGADANLNGSLMGIEGITSPDGRIFGKMGHSERKGLNVAKNIYGEKDQKIFESGVLYFR